MTRELIVATSLALSAVTIGQSDDGVKTIEHAFSSGGIVTLTLSSGDYTVRAGASDRVRVEWRLKEEPGNQTDLQKVQVVSHVAEGVATIRTKGPTSRARFTIDVADSWRHPLRGSHCLWQLGATRMR